jgi:hypothetical protein
MADSVRDERFPVWEALSEFFLDTELDGRDYDRIAKILAASSYSLDELKGILYFEVYPACVPNLFDVAGEWAGFSPDWIMKHIAPRKNKRPIFALPPFHKRLFHDHWEKVSKMILEMPVTK